MGFFGSLFSRKKKSSGLSPEITQTLEKVARLMKDENLQNSMSAPVLKDEIQGGLDVDELPYGIGEFGRSGENPIPVNGVFGELVYLSLLQTQDTNKRLLFHRIGSVESIDIYETVSIDGGNWDILFLSLYHPRKSRKAPNGYLIAKLNNQPFFYGTNQRVGGFPYGLHEAIRQTTKQIIGIPLPPPQVREAEENVSFKRPLEHVERIKFATSQVDGFID